MVKEKEQSWRTKCQENQNNSWFTFSLLLFLWKFSCSANVAKLRKDNRNVIIIKPEPSQKVLKNHLKKLMNRLTIIAREFVAPPTLWSVTQPPRGGHNARNRGAATKGWGSYWDSITEKCAQSSSNGCLKTSGKCTYRMVSIGGTLRFDQLSI